MCRLRHSHTPHLERLERAEKMDEMREEDEMLTVTILKDVFDGIEHYYGKGGLELVTDFARLKNRARESNQLMDELERSFRTLPDEDEGDEK